MHLVGSWCDQNAGYRSHAVEEISRSDAGAKNLQTTAGRIAEVIEESKRDRLKSICFITGVPGAGKTLAGLNIAAKRAERHEDEHAVFLSGNGPLVDVLREALARDQHSRENLAIGEARRRVRTFIQNIHHFRDHYLDRDEAPFENVVVFDEAQRAWTAGQATKFMQARGHDGFDKSEPEFLISVMDRNTDWCTVICLIGGGQTGANSERSISVPSHRMPPTSKYLGARFGKFMAVNALQALHQNIAVIRSGEHRP